MASAAIELRKRESAWASRIGRQAMVVPARPFAQSALDGPHDAVGFVSRLERRVDQNESATLLGRQISVEGDVSVRADDAEPPIAPERRNQRLAFLRVRFA